MSIFKKRTVLCMVVILLVAGIFVGGCGNGHPATSPAELLSLGERFLLEMNYEQALVKFLQVIEIEPMNPRGYTGAAMAHIGLGQMNEAIEVLQLGQNRIPDHVEISDMLIALILLVEYDIIDDEAEANDLPESEAALETMFNPFTVADLENWIFPPGVTAFELFDMGMMPNLERFHFQNGYYVLIHVEGPNSGSYEGINHFIGLDNRDPGGNPNAQGTMRITQVQIDAERSHTTIGPRGVALGMGIEEVIELFGYANPNALDDIMALVNNPPENQGIRVYLYDFWNSNYPHRAFFDLYADHPTDDFALIYEYAEIDGSRFSLSLNFRGGVVTYILVGY